MLTILISLAKLYQYISHYSRNRNRSRNYAHCVDKYYAHKGFCCELCKYRVTLHAAESLKTRVKCKIKDIRK